MLRHFPGFVSVQNHAHYQRFFAYSHTQLRFYALRTRALAHAGAPLRVRVRSELATAIKQSGQPVGDEDDSSQRHNSKHSQSGAVKRIQQGQG